MSKKRRILKQISYLDAETGTVRKKWKGKLPVALIFPNSYHVGMSNLGMQLVYDLLNIHPDVVCERVFLPSDQSIPLSVESGRPLKDFPFLFFTVSFEHDFTGLVDILIRSGIEPLFSKRRAHKDAVEPGHPLVVCGGVATFINPEPIAPFIDLFVLGEIEPVYSQLLQYIFDLWSGSSIEQLLVDMASSLPGCYVPALYTPQYADDGTLAALHSSSNAPQRINKNITMVREIGGHSTVLSSETEFSNIHLAELGRGCSRGCRFCAAGYVYRPPRQWSPQAIIDAIEARPATSRRVGLLGMEMAKADNLAEVASYLLNESCQLSFSSLRADVLGDENLLRLLAESKIKTAAIAPDGSSARLRQVINKGITEDDCLLAAEALVAVGVINLKMYFMIGLPTEEDVDLSEMVDLVMKVQDKINVIGRQRGRLTTITLSINCFVPKAFTPFQYHGFFPVNELKAKVKFLRKSFANVHNIKLLFDQPMNAYFQAMLARGDRRVGKVLPSLLKGTKNWRQTYKDSGIDPEFYAMRERDADELFPWDIVEHGLDKKFLWKEYQLALKATPSRGCDAASDFNCRRCGVCHD